MKIRIFHPFGYEYCYFPKWNWLQKFFIYLFGVVDLPTRIRSIVLRKVLKGRKFRYIVDAGCSAGFYSFYLARKYPQAEVHAYDIDASRLQEANGAREQVGHQNLTFHHQDLSQFDAIPNADLIICFETLQYIVDHAKLLRRFYHALHSEGNLILHVPAHEKLRENASDHIYNTDLLCCLLRTSGFHVEKIAFTFGEYHALLSDIFSVVLHRFPPAIIIVYPILLTLMWFSKFFHAKGRYLLAVATPLQKTQE
jgi:SAM-dependent methyltransferase